MADLIVEISVSAKVPGDGLSFSYDPATLRAHQGDRIRWRCQQGHFTVSFGERTPFDDVDFHSHCSEDERETTEYQRILDDAPLGIYRYAVAVVVDGKVWIDHCPETKIGRKRRL